MIAVSIPEPTARALTPAQQATARASWRDYQLGRLEIAASLKEALYCAQQAEKHGASGAECLVRLEAWAAERGLL